MKKQHLKHALISALFSVTPLVAIAQENATTLEQALSQSLIYSPALKAAQNDIDVAHERKQQALTGWKPKLSLQSGISSTDIESGNFAQGTGATTKDFSASLDQPLYRGGRTVAETRRTSDFITLREIELSNSASSALMDTVQAYMSVIRDAILYDLSLKTQNRIAAEANAAQHRYEAGELTVTDVYQAQSRLAQAEAASESRMTDLEVSRARYAKITGIAPASGLAFPDIPSALPESLENALSRAEASNPNLMVSKAQQKTLRHDVDIARSDLLPRVNAYASYNKQYDPQPGIISDARETQIGLRATMPLYEGGYARSRMREARIVLNREDNVIQETLDATVESVTRAWLAWQLSVTIIEKRAQEVSGTQKSLEGVKAEAEFGERTTLDVLDAEQAFATAQAAYLDARCQQVIAAYTLLNEMGELNDAAL